MLGETLSAIMESGKKKLNDFLSKANLQIHENCIQSSRYFWKKLVQSKRESVAVAWNVVWSKTNGLIVRI